MGQCTRLLYHSSMDQNIKFVNDYAPSPLRKKVMVPRPYKYTFGWWFFFLQFI